MYRCFFKRFIDILAALIVFTCFWWVFLIVGYLVKTKLGSPVIFKQERPGKNGEIFTMYKFRSMTDAKDKDGKLLSDTERLPKFGKLLRATSLDELPELWNVLKGEMSLVGPRPLLVEYLGRYSDFQARRHEVLPGITGWAQVNGRNAISWDEKFRLDVDYVDSYNFLLDIQILFLTVKKVFVKEGISQENNATMTKFEGNKL
ncbi:sugar transferase (plasmid) [Cetobacterium somerae]|uniref:sugar transferase n=1 Tax=Cetobacterium somerae TaxID=188913 RepID=UPI001F0536B5|nr:sugar transferase [Cetobacterium somerae]UPO98523.1 sugar transferase [Cetobacterium somerae]